jgi:hypothetical protein
VCAALSPARSDCAVGAQPSKRKEQRKLNGAGTADADQPPAKRQRTEEEEREWKEVVSLRLDRKCARPRGQNGADSTENLKQYTLTK